MTLKPKQAAAVRVRDELALAGIEPEPSGLGLFGERPDSHCLHFSPSDALLCAARNGKAQGANQNRQ